MENLKLSVEELNELISTEKTPKIIDIREEYEVLLNPLPFEQTVHIPMAEYKDFIDDEDEIILVCRSGERAYNLAYYIFKTLNKSNVKFVEGGAQEILGIEI